MQPEMSFSDAIVSTMVHVAPSFLVVVFVLVLFSWLRLLVDAFSGRGF